MINRIFKRLFCKHYFSKWLYDYQSLYYAHPMCFMFSETKSKWRCQDCGKEYTSRCAKNNENKKQKI